jgi:FkbM family methyltransferase
MNLLKKIYLTLQSQGRHPLNRHSSLRAAWNFSLAQISARLVPGEVCVAFPNETRLLVPPKMKGAAHFIYPGVCEFEEMSFVLHFARPNELFVDVGANIGAYTILAAGAVGSAGIAFEPNPSTFRALEANIHLNNLGSRVKLVNAALGKNEGILRMTDGLGTENRACAEDQKSGGVSVPMTTLDKILAGQNPVLLKMDVEGFETQVFSGATQTLANFSLQAMIVEKNGAGHAYGFDEEALHQKIRDHGFNPCTYSPFDRKLTPVSVNVGGNIIYIRDVNASRQKLQAAPIFHFKGFKI